MSDENEWKDLKVELPPARTTVEFWDDYGEQVLTGEYYHYDGKHVAIKMRHWWHEEPLYDFTHWRKRSRGPSGEIPD